MENNKERWQCRVAPSLGEFEESPEKIWGTESPSRAEWDDNAPTVFFGLYGLPDFYFLWRHKGRKCILWAGSDIRNFIAGYWLDGEGSIRLSARPLATWINKNCESYVENEVEAAALRRVGIEPKIVPSFLGDVNDFPLSFTPEEKIRLYTSVSGDEFELYGWDKIPELAQDNPNVQFHLYGNSKPYFDDNGPGARQRFQNVFEHGRVSKEQMNREVKGMTGALRLTEFDGFSEIIAKSLLWGQWPISVIQYAGTIGPREIEILSLAKFPNIAGREWLLSVINKFPWNQK